MEKCILTVVNAGAVGFNDKNHFRNFMKYFFGSRSGRHTVNHFTKYNTLTRIPTKDDKDYIFTDDPLVLTKFFFEKYSVDDYENHRTDVLYTPFLFGVGDVAISNFVRYNQELQDIEISLFVDGEAVYNAILNQYGGERALEVTIKAFLEGYESLIPYKEYTEKEDRLQIEKVLHLACQESYPIKESDIVLSISHSDQFEDHPDYHIHRIYKV